jgi:hypothetical protein
MFLAVDDTLGGIEFEIHGRNTVTS